MYRAEKNRRKTSITGYKNCKILEKHFQNSESRILEIENHYNQKMLSERKILKKKHKCPIIIQIIIQYTILYYINLSILSNDKIDWYIQNNILYFTRHGLRHGNYT